MSIAANKKERDQLAAKIIWLESYKSHEVSDRRVDGRMVPTNPISKLILPDGNVENCLVIDLSVSGAAISAETMPDVGTILPIGSVVGRVVRHFVGGVERQERYSVEKMVILGA